MNPSRLVLAAAIAASLGAAQAQTPSQPSVPPLPAPLALPPPDSDLHYAMRIDARFGGFAGSSANLESLAAGLRHGSEIQLSSSGETLSFTPPTKPMGYGNITRTLDLAMRDLVSAGITDPTPSEIQAALMGATVSTPTGDVTFSGVLQLRSQGMGWGQIAHAIGVHPGLGSGKPLPATAPLPSPSGAGASGITTASGTAVARPGSNPGHGAKSSASLGHGGAVTNAAGSAAASSAAALHQSRGQGNANAFGKSQGKF